MPVIIQPIFAEIATKAAEAQPGIIRTLAFNENGIDWHTDWWKLLIVGFASLLFLFLLVKLTLYILRMIGVFLCIAAGAAGAYVTQAFLTQPLASRMPESLQRFAPIAAGLIGFIFCYCISAFIMAIIRKPAQAMPKAKE